MNARAVLPKQDDDAANQSPHVARPSVAQVTVYTSLQAASAAWHHLASITAPGPYQDIDWVEAWMETIGASRGIQPFIVVGEDADGRPLALLPLGVRQRAGLDCAAFLGDRDANGNMGLFDPAVTWNRDQIEAVLDAVASRNPIDLFHLANQRHAWGNHRNPLELLASQPSASAVHAVELDPDPERFLVLNFSKHARKRFRNKLAKLKALGAVRYQRARTQTEISRVLDAYGRQKTARLHASSAGRDTLSATFRSFVERAAVAASSDVAAIELHALLCGEQIVATLGGTGGHERFSGMFISFEADESVARCSPGDLLLIEVLAAKCREGVTSFDLGIGEARYKETFCPEVEPLFDQFIGISAKGKLATGLWAWAARRKHWVKQTPWAFAAVTHLRRRLRSAIGRL